jgi:hypothetical protein
MSEPYKGLNAALARNSGPSAEDVETIAALLWQSDRDASPSGLGYGASYADDPCQFAYRAQARAILASDWLAAHTAAAEARGAERGARAVVEAVEAADVRGCGCDCERIIWAAAREAAARVEGGA